MACVWAPLGSAVRGLGVISSPEQCSENPDLCRVFLWRRSCVRAQRLQVAEDECLMVRAGPGAAGEAGRQPPLAAGEHEGRAVTSFASGTDEGLCERNPLAPGSVLFAPASPSKRSLILPKRLGRGEVAHLFSLYVPLTCCAISSGFEGLENWFWVVSVKLSVPLKYSLLLHFSGLCGRAPTT